MTIQSVPTFDQNVVSQGKATTPWYRFFQGLYKGIPPASEVAVTPTASPFTFTTVQRGFVIVQGGSVSMVQFSRGGVTNHVTGQTSGCFPISSGDSLIITYSSAPTLTFVPQ